MSNSSLRVPKHKVEVELRDTAGEVREVEVYLAESGAEERRERLQDLLANRRFVPVRHADELSFISREHVTWLKLDLISAIDELDPEAEGNVGSVSAGISVVFDDGTSLDGGIRYLLPRTSRRVGDYLESLPQFFPLRTPDWLYLVNRDCIVRVTPVDEVTS